MMTTPLSIRELSIQESTKGQAICPYCGVGCRLLLASYVIESRDISPETECWPTRCVQ